MKLIKNYLYNVVYQVFILLVPFATIPYLSRVLGPDGVGINSYTNSIIQMFILLGSLGTNMYGNRQIAFVRDDKEKLSQTFYEITILRMMIFLFASLAFVIFMILNREFRIFYWAQALSILAAMIDVAWFFMGLEKFAVTVLRNIVVKVLTLILIFTFVKTSDDLLTYILIVSLSLIIGNLTLLPELRKHIYKPKINSLRISQHLLPSLILFIPQISTQIYVILNKALLGSIETVTISGYFDQSDKIIKMILAIVTATGTVMMPHVANAFAKGNSQKAKKYLYTSFSFVSLISIPMFLGLAAVSTKFVPLFFSSEFLPVVPIMMIESVVILLVAWSNVLGTQYLYPTNQTGIYTKSIVWGIVVNLIADVPLILLFQARGAAIATVLSELAVFIYQLLSMKSQINYAKLFSDTWKYFVAGAVMFLLVLGIDHGTKSSWSMIMVEMVCGITIYLTLLIFLKAKLILKVREYISGRLI